jgi:hypothetical protein
MNEDDADQGRGLDTKYRIDSAQGESLSLSLNSFHSLTPPLLLLGPHDFTPSFHGFGQGS